MLAGSLTPTLPMGYLCGFLGDPMISVTDGYTEGSQGYMAPRDAEREHKQLESAFLFSKLRLWVLR